MITVNSHCYWKIIWGNLDKGRLQTFCFPSRNWNSAASSKLLRRTRRGVFTFESTIQKVRFCFIKWNCLRKRILIQKNLEVTLEMMKNTWKFAGKVLWNSGKILEFCQSYSRQNFISRPIKEYPRSSSLAIVHIIELIRTIPVHCRVLIHHLYPLFWRNPKLYLSPIPHCRSQFRWLWRNHPRQCCVNIYHTFQ